MCNECDWGVIVVSVCCGEQRDVLGGVYLAHGCGEHECARLCVQQGCVVQEGACVCAANAAGGWLSG